MLAAGEWESVSSSCLAQLPGWWRRSGRKEESASFSLRSSLAGEIGCFAVGRCLSWRGFTGARRAAASSFNDSHGAVGVDEDRICDAADIGFADLIDAVDGAKQFAPVAVARLVGGKLRG